MEYQYRFANSAANDNYRMWIRDDERIHQIANGSYIVAIGSEWIDGHFNSFKEAESILEDENEDFQQVS
jgi:hypothetical protein